MTGILANFDGVCKSISRSEMATMKIGDFWVPPHAGVEYWKSDGERFVSDKPNDKQKLIEKMRANTERQNRKTEALPIRRSRRRMQKTKHEAATNPARLPIST